MIAHETIHRIQALQATAVTPAGTLGALVGDRPSAASGDVTFDVRTEWFYAVNATLWVALADYLDRWPEIEARALDEPARDEPSPMLRRPPPAGRD